MTLQKLFQMCAYEIDYDTIGDSVNYKFIEEDEGETLYIYFQGSNSISDWVENFLFTKKLYKEFKVHRGFYRAYSQVRDLMLNMVYCHDYKKIIVVGYSHGGALAQLAHEDVVYHFPNLEVKTYAFEAPRCLKVNKRYRERWKNLTMIKNGNDIVTHMPPKIFGYTDLGTTIKIKGDTSLVNKRIPKCVKYHFPQVVLNGIANRFTK